MYEFKIGDTVSVIKPHCSRDVGESGVIVEIAAFGMTKPQFMIDFAKDLGDGITHNCGEYKIYKHNHYRWYCGHEIEPVILDEIEECTEEELMSIL